MARRGDGMTEHSLHSRCSLYTYADPSEIYLQPYWRELRRHPHICADGALRDALLSEYGRRAFTHIATVDALFAALYENYDDAPVRDLAHRMAYAYDCAYAEARYLSPLRLAVPDGVSHARRRIADCANAMHGAYRVRRGRDGILDALQGLLQDEVCDTLLGGASPDLPLVALLDGVDAGLDAGAGETRELIRYYAAVAAASDCDAVVLHNITRITPEVCALVRLLEDAGIHVIYLYHYVDNPRYAGIRDICRAWTGSDPHDVCTTYDTDASASDGAATAHICGTYAEWRCVGDRADWRMYAVHPRASDAPQPFATTCAARFVGALFDVFDAMEGGLSALPALLSARDGLRGGGDPLRARYVYDKVRLYVSDCATLDDVRAALSRLATTDVSPYNPDILSRIPYFAVDSRDVALLMELLRECQTLYAELEPLRDAWMCDTAPGRQRVTRADARLARALSDALDGVGIPFALIDTLELRRTAKSYADPATRAQEPAVRDVTRVVSDVLAGRMEGAHVSLGGLTYRDVGLRMRAVLPDGALAYLEAHAACAVDAAVQAIVAAYRNAAGVVESMCDCATRYGKAASVTYALWDGDVPLRFATQCTPADEPRASRQPARRAPDPLPPCAYEIGDEESREVFNTCPYRYLLTRALDPQGSYTEAHDVRYLCTLLLFCHAWQDNVGVPQQNAAYVIAETEPRIWPLFPFLTDADRAVVRAEAGRMLTMPSMLQGDRIQSYHRRYVRRLASLYSGSRAIAHDKLMQRRIDEYVDAVGKEPLHRPSVEVCERCPAYGVCLPL